MTRLRAFSARHIFLLTVCSALVRSASASEIVADVLEVSTISTPAPSPGIQFTGSAVFHSSLTLQGSGGYVTGQSSVTASAFFGDGSQIEVVAVLSSTETFSGGVTFGSTISIQSGGREIVLSTGSTANLKIAVDGQTSFYPELHNSTYTTIPYATTSATTFGSCVTGSTVALTTAGGSVEVRFTGILRNTTLSATATLTMLEDGAFLPGLSSTKGIVRSNFAPSEGAYDVGPFAYLLEPAAGLHSYCISIAAPDGGTTELGETTFDFRSFLFVKELR